MRILHAPRNPAGIATGLAAGEERLGHDPDVLSLYREFTQYSGERCLDLGGRGKAGRFRGHLTAFLDHRAGYDVYDFLGGSTFLHYPRWGLDLLDLSFLQRSAKVVFTYVGSDARRVSEHKSPLLRKAVEKSLGGHVPESRLRQQEAIQSRAIEKARRHAHHIRSVNPDLLAWLGRDATFLPYPVAGLERARPGKSNFFSDGKLHIVHAPTNRALKGTRFVLEAIERLESSSSDRIRFTLAEGLPHSEMQKVFRSADLLIDQLLIGWYGMAAAEAMAIGVPVVSFIEDRDTAALPAEMARELPVIRADPSNLTAVLTDLVNHRDRLIEIGRQSRNFARSWHDPVEVARRALAHY